MSDEPHTNIIVENVEWHTFYDLLDEMEQLAKNNESSIKPAERLLEVRAISLPILVSFIADAKTTENHAPPMARPGALPNGYLLSGQTPRCLACRDGRVHVAGGDSGA
jgi:hypothetical protein